MENSNARAQETPRFTENLVRYKLTANSMIDEKIAPFFLTGLIINILWPIHRERSIGLSIEEIKNSCIHFDEQTFN